MLTPTASARDFSWTFSGSVKFLNCLPAACRFLVPRVPLRGWRQPRPQGAFPWLSPPPKPGKSALGTRLGWRMSFRIGLWDINLQNICPLEKGTNCCLVFSFFALCAKYFFHRLTRPVKHINPRNKAFYSGNYRNNTAGSKTLQMAGLVEELSGLSSC